MPSRLGMQRFGTASIPTHAIGLALLKSEWQKAISLILSVRPGEHPDITAAREAWLKDHDIDRALELLPRRVVAERCILESFKKQKGDTRNAMGALSTVSSVDCGSQQTKLILCIPKIPRNLRLMYVHAYQSYVWNAIVSERIRMYGAEKPVVGDLVFETESDDQDLDAECESEEVEPGTVPFHSQPMHKRIFPESMTSSEKRSRKPWSAPRIKTLTEEDLENYSIFDVIMPLPGTDVAYPGGMLGEKYCEFLRTDGLDPDNFTRKQRLVAFDVHLVLLNYKSQRLHAPWIL